MYFRLEFLITELTMPVQASQNSKQAMRYDQSAEEEHAAYSKVPRWIPVSP